MKTRTRLTLILVGCLLLIPSLSRAEMTRERKNLVGGEILGRGLFLTVNYERYFTDVLGAGLGLFGLSSSDGAFVVIPVYASATIGNPHSLYLSAGVTFFGGADFDNPGDETASASTPVVAVGYQYTADSGLYIRPTFNLMTEFSIVWPGFAIGGSF